jgi:hypothetical protein
MKRKFIFGIAVALLAIITGVLVSASRIRNIYFTLQSGSSVSVMSAPIRKLFSVSKCTIIINSGSAGSGRVDLLQSFSESPVIVIPSTVSNVFFCVYDNDVDWQLLKIDLGQPFTTLPPENPMRSKVLYSTCRIERVRKAETNDWNAVAAALDKMPAEQFRNQSVSFNFVVYRAHYSQKQIVASMRNSGDQGQYEGDTIFLQYKMPQKTNN